MVDSQRGGDGRDDGEAALNRRDVLAGTAGVGAVGIGLTAGRAGALSASESPRDSAATRATDGGAAGDPARFVHERQVVVDEQAHGSNVVPWDQQKVISYNGYQYVPYWDDDLDLVLARRNLETGDVQTLQFSYELSKPDDAHNNTAIGISPNDGRLHMAYDHHAQPINYRYSEAGFIDDPPETLSTDQFSDNTDMFADPDISEGSVTYPRFFTNATEDLYLVYRQGGSGNGDTLFHRHDADTNTWSRLGTAISKDGVYGPWGDSDARNAYLHDLTFDDTNRLHMTWTFRETYATYGSNHDLHYAYSDDGGVTWMNNDGEQIADLDADDPIRVDDPGIVVVEVPPYSWLINQGTQALDAQNQPHVFTSRATTTTEVKREANRHYVHYWRTPDGEWHEQFIDDTAVDLSAHGLNAERSDLLFDDANNLHVYSDAGGAMYVGTATAAADWGDWEIYRVADDGVHGKHDERRWAQDGVLTVPGVSSGDAGMRFVLEEYTPGDLGLEAPDLAVESESACPEPDPEIVLSWDGASGAVRYSVDRRRADGGSWQTVAQGVGERSFVASYADRDLSFGTTYEYRVHAEDGSGTREASNTVTAEPVPPAEPDWTWESDGDMQGWITRDDADPTVSDGALHLAVTGGDPQAHSPCVSVDADAADTVLVRMRNELETEQAMLYWRSADTEFRLLSSTVFSVSAGDESYQTYRLDMSDHPEWEGTISQIRLDPLHSPSGTGTVHVDRIAVGSAGDFDVSTATETQTVAPTDDATETATDTESNDSPPTPGFGVGAAVAGAVGAALAALRRRDDGDAD
jgi:PGF-CTERM protein